MRITAGSRIVQSLLLIGWLAIPSLSFADLKACVVIEGANQGNIVDGNVTNNTAWGRGGGFFVNAGAQVHRITTHVDRRMQALVRDPAAVERLPPIKSTCVAPPSATPMILPGSQRLSGSSEQASVSV